MPKTHSETAFAPMCVPPEGRPWFAISFIRHSRRDVQSDFINAIAGNGNWRVLEAQGWRIVRVKVIAQ